jgi:hypothetical protein
MAKMTKAQIRERQEAIMNQMDEMEKKSREANGGEIKFTEDEAAKYDALVRESAGLSARAKELASDAELAQIRSNEEKGAKLREVLQNCKNKRENATTILANAAAGNVNGNLDAGGLIPVRIEEIIDTKVPGIELPADLKMVTGVTGTEIIPYSTNDVKFTVNGEVQKVSEQGLDFANIQAQPQRVAASVAVSHRAIDNAAFDILGFIVFKLSKGLAMFEALHVYSHCNFDTLKSPFASVTPETLVLDENIGKNLAKKIAEMYDLGFEGVPYLTMDKVTEVELAYTKAIPGTAGDRTVVEDGKCCGYPYTVSPYIDYVLNSASVPVKDSDRYIGIGHYGYLALQQHGEFRLNIDAVSAANFDRGTVTVGVSTDLSLTELSSKVNGKNQIQAFKLIKLVEPEASTEA